jgi:TP901 family phage tail tape measure protein
MGGIQAMKIASEGLVSGFGNLKFGLQNIGTAGTISGDAFIQAAKGFGVATLAIDALAIAAAGVTIKMAADFQQGINRLKTGAGDAQDSFQTLHDGIQKVAMDTGTMTGPLTDAMYQILSAGQRGAQAFDTLSVSAKAATIEQANVVDVSKAVSTAMTDYGTKTYNATQFANGLVAAVANGKITLEDLSTAMSPIIPQTSNAGVNFQNLSAAMATMTSSGANAAQAATGLRFLIGQLAAPTRGAMDEMNKLGLSSADVAKTMRTSLPQALQMVYDAAKKAGPEGSEPFNEAVKSMIGNQRGLAAFSDLTGVHLQTFTDNVGKVSTAMQGSSTDVNGWTTAQSNLNVQVDKAKASLEVLAQNIGMHLIPVLEPLVKWVTDLIDGFNKWSMQGDNLRNVLIAVGVVLGIATAATAALGIALAVAAVPAMVAMVAAAWPIIAVVGAMALAIAGVILVITNWGNIMDWLSGKSDTMAATVKANNLVASAGLDEKKIQDNANKVVNIRKDMTDQLAIINGNGTQDEKDAAKKKYADDLQQQEVYNKKSVQLEVDRRYKISQLQSTPEGRNALIAAQKKTNDTELKQAQDHYNALVEKRKGLVKDYQNANTTDEKNTAQHNLNVNQDDIAAAGQKVANLKNTGQKLTDQTNANNKQIEDAQQNALKRFGPWFEKKLQDIWDNVSKNIGQGFSDLGITMQGIMANIGSNVGEGFSNLGTNIQNAMANSEAIVGKSFSDMGTSLRNKMTDIKNGVGGTFNELGTVLRNKATDIKNWVGDQFNAMGTTLNNKMNDIKNWVGEKLDGLKNVVQQKLNDVVGFFRNLPGQIMGALSGLPGSLFSSGANAVQGMVNGLTSKLGGIRDVAGQIAGAIGNHLGFSSPTKEGPGRTADRWAPSLMKMMTSGIEAGTPALQAALMNSLKNPIALNNLAMTVLAQRSVSIPVATLSAPAAVAAAPGVGAGTLNQQIILEIDGRELANAIGKGMVAQIRLEMGKGSLRHIHK